MPQMMPMWWIMLNIYFILLFMFMSMMIYYFNFMIFFKLMVFKSCPIYMKYKKWLW